MSFWSPEEFRDVGATSGTVYLFGSQEKRNRYGSENQRDNFINELNKLHIFNYDLEDFRSGYKKGGSSDYPLHDLSEEEFAKFMVILDGFCFNSKGNIKNRSKK